MKYSSYSKSGRVWFKKKSVIKLLQVTKNSTVIEKPSFGSQRKLCSVFILAIAWLCDLGLIGSYL